MSSLSSPSCQTYMKFLPWNTKGDLVECLLILYLRKSRGRHNLIMTSFSFWGNYSFNKLYMHTHHTHISIKYRKTAFRSTIYSLSLASFLLTSSLKRNGEINESGKADLNSFVPSRLQNLVKHLYMDSNEIQSLHIKKSLD